MAEAASGFGVVPLDPPVRNREIKDVETMRLVADPTRLAILRVLMNDAEFEPPVHVRQGTRGRPSRSRKPSSIGISSNWKRPA